MKSPILGLAYVASSVNAADNRMVNLYPEMVPEGGKEPAFLKRCPGMTNLNAPIPATDRVRGVIFMGTLLYVVAGDTFYVLNGDNPSNPVIASYAIVTNNSEPVSMAENGHQIFIASGSYCHCYDVAVGMTALTAGVYPNFNGAETVVFMDGYFVVNQPTSQKIWISALYDGLTWNALTFASAERSPDNVVGLCANNGELWVFGESTTEVWYNAGSPGFPFAPIQGAYSELGCASKHAIAKMDNAIFWVGSDTRGNGIVYRSRGYAGERVSTHMIEDMLQARTAEFGIEYLSNAVAYTYQSDGHSFYMLSVINFSGSPSGTELTTTLAYDVATQGWHERQSIIPGTTDLSYHWGSCYAFRTRFQYKNYGVVGSFYGGLYVFSDTVYKDDTEQQIFKRSWRALPTGANTLNRTAQHSLQLDCETGVGDGAGSNPLVFLRWSDDGGHTWNAGVSRYLGFLGDYGTRVIVRRMGMTMKLRDRVYELSGGDNHPMNIMGAELILSPTSA